MKSTLSFQHGNAKLPGITTFSLPAGYTCPGALFCLTFADRITGTIKDGSEQEIRCFSANDEARHTSVRTSRWRNFEALKAAGTREAMLALILASLPKKAKIVRIHVSGDFFSEAYFLAWTDVARARPDIRFYAYTKSIHLWKKLQEFVPDNLILTASLGGKYDAATTGLKTAKVVFEEEQAEALGLEIDHDDSHAYNGKDSFALLIHGTQRKGSRAAAALNKLRAAGVRGYSRPKKQTATL
jgi:hypothetical protein